MWSSWRGPSHSCDLRHKGSNGAQWGSHTRDASHLKVINPLHCSLIGPLQRLITSTNGSLPAAGPQQRCWWPLGVVKEEKTKEEDKQPNHIHVYVHICICPVTVWRNSAEVKVTYLSLSIKTTHGNFFTFSSRVHLLATHRVPASGSLYMISSLHSRYWQRQPPTSSSDDAWKTTRWSWTCRNVGSVTSLFFFYILFVNQPRSGCVTVVWVGVIWKCKISEQLRLRNNLGSWKWWCDRNTFLNIYIDLVICLVFFWFNSK